MKKTKTKRIVSQKFKCSAETKLKAAEITKKIIAKYGQTKYSRMSEAEITKVTKPWSNLWKVRKLVIHSQQTKRQNRLTRLAAQTRERYHKNPGKFIARRRAYRETHQDQIKSYSQAYNEKNRDKINAHNRERRQQHKANNQPSVPRINLWRFIKNMALNCFNNSAWRSQSNN